jgi:hypothetical protein
MVVGGSCRLKKVEKGERNIKNNEKNSDINSLGDVNLCP